MARLVLGLVVCLAVALFAAENSQPTTIRFLGLQSPPIYLAVVVLASALLGALAVFLLGGLQVLRLRRRIAQLERGPEPPAAPSPPGPGLSPAVPSPPAPGLSPAAPTPPGPGLSPAVLTPPAQPDPPGPPAEGDGAGDAPAGPGG